MSGPVQLERPLASTNGLELTKLSDALIGAVSSRNESRIASQSRHDASQIAPSAYRNDEEVVHRPDHVKVDMEDERCMDRADVQSIASSRVGEASVRTCSPLDREEQPEAGPSNPYRNSRRSLRLGNSTTSFLDVTDWISNISEYPVSVGGYCDVHTADMFGEGLVALKRLRLFETSRKAKNRFHYEAEIWIRLDHTNVLRFFGICQTGPTMYMVSPWQKNGHMLAYFESHPEANRLNFVIQVADALAFLHSNDPKIIHGDIKGQNVLVSDSGEALLCDFGLSMVLSEIAIISGVPTGVPYGGSIRWLAPEIMRGSEVKTEASDVFSFALLVIEAFTGSVPFSELKIDAAVMNAVLNGKRPEDPFQSGVIEEERLWRLLQLCWHQTVVVRPRMSQVQAIMHSLRTENTDLRDSKLGLSRALVAYALEGNCSLDEYIGQSKRAKPPEHLFTVTNLERSSTSAAFANSHTRIPPSFILLLGSHVCVWLTSLCALVLNSVLLSYFQKGSSLLFRRIVPVFGFVTWGWLLAAELWLLLIYGGLLLSPSSSGALRFLLFRYPWRIPSVRSILWILGIVSCLVSISNAILLLVITSSPLFARERPTSARFHRLLLALDVLSLFVMTLAMFDCLWLAWRVMGWKRLLRLAAPLAPPTRPISHIQAVSSINVGEDEENNANPELQAEPEQEPQNEQLPKTGEVSNEEETQRGLSARQKGKQRAV